MASIIEKGPVRPPWQGSQFYHFFLEYFRSDLHGCSVDSALRITKGRLDDCFRYGIQYLEIVHGSDKHNKNQGMGTIGSAVRSLSHPAIRSIVPLDSRSSVHTGGDPSTATRFCLHLNPVPAPRSPAVVFPGYRMDYEYPGEYLDWSDRHAANFVYEGTDDIHPFDRSRGSGTWATFFDVLEALNGHPFVPLRKSVPGFYASSSFGRISEKEVIAASVAVLPEANFHDDDWTPGDAEDNPNFNLTARFNRRVRRAIDSVELSFEQFQEIRQRAVKGYLPIKRMAEAIGCPEKFIKEIFSPSSPRFAAFHLADPVFVLNRIDEQGEPELEPYYSFGSQPPYAKLWEAVKRIDPSGKTPAHAAVALLDSAR